MKCGPCRLPPGGRYIFDLFPDPNRRRLRNSSFVAEVATVTRNVFQSNTESSTFLRASPDLKKQCEGGDRCTGACDDVSY